jgi:hypothetical protein
MLTWQGLEKTCIGIYFSDPLIEFEIIFFSHGSQYIVYYNFHVYKFEFYSHKNMLWLFE